jgi:ribose/xylose/arabinose/galactoside ABC-type transport system permease subunit
MARAKAHLHGAPWKGSHLFLPLSVLALLVAINLTKGADYFSMSLINGALYGNIPNILFGASELVILAIGMTLVTASSRGQDISVGVAGAITSAVFVRLLLGAGGITWLTILACFLAARSTVPWFRCSESSQWSRPSSCSRRAGRSRS